MQNNFVPLSSGPDLIAEVQYSERERIKFNEHKLFFKDKQYIKSISTVDNLVAFFSEDIWSPI